MRNREEPLERETDDSFARMPYSRPQIKRVDLALAETLSAGCKLAGTCDDEFDPVSEAGS